MLSLPDLSIRQLEYLVAVAEENTWADASDAVGVTPSALSQGLAELERRVGVPLFDRVGRRRILHPNAEIVLDHARQVISLTNDLAKWSDRTRNAHEGTIRVGMIDIAAVNYFLIYIMNCQLPEQRKPGCLRLMPIMSLCYHFD